MELKAGLESPLHCELTLLVRSLIGSRRVFREVALVLATDSAGLESVRQPPYEALAPIALSCLPATMASDHGCEGGDGQSLDSQSRDGSQMANRVNWLFLVAVGEMVVIQGYNVAVSALGGGPAKHANNVRANLAHSNGIVWTDHGSMMDATTGMTSLNASAQLIWSNSFKS
nr:hypothetical protein Itr_chr03CG13680 [Ipomoea trifida]